MSQPGFSSPKGADTTNLLGCCREVNGNRHKNSVMPPLTCGPPLSWAQGEGRTQEVRMVTAWGDPEPCFLASQLLLCEDAHTRLGTAIPGRFLFLERKGDPPRPHSLTLFPAVLIVTCLGFTGSLSEEPCRPRSGGSWHPGKHALRPLRP